MKVILYMAMTVNGMIARENDDTPWSKAVWREYYKFIKQKRNIIIGRRTYELMKSVNEFEKLNRPVTVVLSGKKTDSEGNIFFATSPESALKIMKQHSIKDVVVGGGSKLNASFLKAGLVDEMYLDVEPWIFGSGIKLFSETNAEAELTLIKVRKLSKNTIRLIYKVKNRAKKTK